MILLLLGLILYVIYYYWNVRKYPRGPFPLPLIGNLYHLNPDELHEYVTAIGEDYGHCLTLFLPRPVVFMTHFSTVNEALVIKGDDFIGRSQLPPEMYLQPAVQTGVTISDGEVWKEQRRVSMKIMREHGMGRNLMEEQVNRSIDEMLHQLNDISDGITPIDMNIPLQLCVGNVINETLFGYHFKYTDTAQFEFFLSTVSTYLRMVRDNAWTLIVQAWPWTKHLPIIGQKGYRDPINVISKYHDFIREETIRIAAAFDRSQEPTNFIQSYLLEMEKNPLCDFPNLNVIIVDFWIAGSETLSTTLRWAILLFMEHPRIQEKMRAEILSVVGRGRRLEMNDKSNLPYVNAAITEVQRWANILPFLQFHRCTKDSVIGGKFVPANTLTLPETFSVMRDPEIFENPREFRPERFLEEKGKTSTKKQLERVVAFGMGRRQCMGEGMARMELFLVLGTLLLNYRFEPIGPVDLTVVFGSILAPRPQKCRVIPI